MPLPETLRKLLTAPGPSGYEQAPAAVFREAAAAFAEVTHDTRGLDASRACEGTGDGPLARGRRPHRRDRADRPPHRRRRLPLVHRRRRLGPDDPRRPARRGRHARRRASPASSARSRSTCSRTRSARRCPSCKRPAHRHRRRRTATTRARCVRIGDVAVIAGEPVECPNGRVVSRSMDNRLGCFVALEAARLVAEAGGAPGDVAARRGRAGGDHLRRRAHDRLLAAARHRDRRRRDVRDRRARHRREGARPAQVRLRPGDRRAARRSTRTVFELLHAAGEAEGIPFTVAASARAHRHRRRRVPHLARRHPDRRRLDPAALHALAGRDGAARRRRERGEADRRVRAAARAPTSTSAR